MRKANRGASENLPGSVVSLLGGMVTRGAVLHVPSSGGNGLLQRPLQHLYPLEVAAHTLPQESSDTSSDKVPDTAGTGLDIPQMEPEPGSAADTRRVRPRRAAAMNARNRLAACAVLESNT